MYLFFEVTKSQDQAYTVIKKIICYEYNLKLYFEAEIGGGYK